MRYHHEQILPPPSNQHDTTSPPVHKQPRTCVQQQSTKDTRPKVEVPVELGELIKRDMALVERDGWDKFVRERRGRGDLAEVKELDHPARRLLRRYQTRGVPVVMHDGNWTSKQIKHALDRGPHMSAFLNKDFLCEEFIEMINSKQWVILPQSVASKLNTLRISPPGVVPQRDRRPRWIGDYTWSGVNSNTLPVIARESLQYGRALDRFLRHILLADPRYGPVYLSKCDIADGYYRLHLTVQDCPKLALAFPASLAGDPLVAIPLVLPMGWTNSGPAFCAVTETIADLANKTIMSNAPSPMHPLDKKAAAFDTPAMPHHNVTRPISRDPCLHRPNPRRAAYIDVFVDDFINLCQGGPRWRSYIRRVLFNHIDSLLRPVDQQDDPNRREPISIKKLLKGDASWSTEKVILGWVVNTATQTIHLPPHRVERLQEILNMFPTSKKRTTVKTWQKVLGELRSMALALPGARGLFGAMQHALSNAKSNNRITLTKDTHAALQDFRTLARDVTSRPTRIAELVPLVPSVTGAHDASGKGAGGVIFAQPHIAARNESCQHLTSPTTTANATPASHQCEHHPVVYRMPFPDTVRPNIVSSANPNGKINNSELELLGSYLHHAAVAANFDVRERTVSSASDNTPTVAWQRKGSVTSVSLPTHILRLQALHQRQHRYVPRHDYIIGDKNSLADDASRLTHLSDIEFLHHFNTKYPQKLPWRLWTPPPQLTSVLTLLLHNQRCDKAYVPAPTAPPLPIGPCGAPSVMTWPSTPYSPISKTRLPSSKSLLSGTVLDKLPQIENLSEDAPWKVPYGLLAKRLPVWGPRTLV